MALRLDGRRKELCDWLEANNIDDLSIVPHDSDLTISTDTRGVRTLHYEVYVRDGDGKPAIDDRGADVVTERRSVPLMVEPPDWWEPYEKPTRAQLLAVVEEVRALRDDLRGVTGARWIADSLDKILEGKNR